MKSLRRFDFSDTDYFITAVTYNRRNILLHNIPLFFDSWTKSKPSAYVILPDHFHIMINSGIEGISALMHHFKIEYSRAFRDRYGSGRVWQNRFWDHIIRDHDDLRRHPDYIHYNPVKHGITDDPFNYQFSSLNHFFEKGYYSRDWGVLHESNLEDDFGE